MKSEWGVISETVTGVRLVSLTDFDTGCTVRTPISVNGLKFPAVIAWAGARYSRSADSAHDILKEIRESGKDAEVKLANFFRNYGHASVADMASVMVFIEKLPMWLAFDLFYISAVHAGQERSTRFQDFQNSTLVNLELLLPQEVVNDPRVQLLKEKRSDLASLSLTNYRKWVEILTESFTKFYKPDLNNPKHVSALQARVFDCARYMLLMGFTTSIAYLTSAREWSRLISQTKGSKIEIKRRLGEQLEELLAPSQVVDGYTPEVSSLIRHTEASEQTTSNLLKLKGFLTSGTEIHELLQGQKSWRGLVGQDVEVYTGEHPVGLKMMAQGLLALWPGLHYSEVTSWLQAQPEAMQVEMGKILLLGHDHRNIIGNIGEARGISSVFTVDRGAARDINRHRGHGRFTPCMEEVADENNSLMGGFILPLYLSEVDAFGGEAIGFAADLYHYYRRLFEFYAELNSVVGSEAGIVMANDLSPLAGSITYIMHGEPKQTSYKSHLRERSGGHINYRDLVWLAASRISRTDPFLAGIALQSSRPNPGSREEFFDRS